LVFFPFGDFEEFHHLWIFGTVSIPVSGSLAPSANVPLASTTFPDFRADMLWFDPFAALGVRTVDTVAGGVLAVLFVPELFGGVREERGNVV
jgi:hypothetical protein